MTKEKKELSSFELTVPFETRIKVSHDIKLEKYSGLQNDINNSTEYKATITPVTVGSRGFIDTENKSILRQVYDFTKKEVTFKKFVGNISSLATMFSYYLFVSRNEPVWSDTPFIQPVHKPKSDKTSQCNSA